MSAVRVFEVCSNCDMLVIICQTQLVAVLLCRLGVLRQRRLRENSLLHDGIQAVHVSSSVVTTHSFNTDVFLHRLSTLLDQPILQKHTPKPNALNNTQLNEETNMQ